MKIRNIEVDFNFLDADDVEKFEKEAKRVKEECNSNQNREMSYSEAIREECKVINTFFDNVFGEGISQKLFNGKNNLEDHIRAFEGIVSEKMKQQEGLNNALTRYQPNREQRRYNQFQKRNRR